LEIKETAKISNREIAKGVLNMADEDKVDLLERLISMESVEKQKWNIIISCRMLSKSDISLENIDIILSELSKLQTTLKAKAKKLYN
jgi:hypothetical protein